MHIRSILLVLLAPLAAFAQSQTVAIEGGKVIAVDGPTLETGTVVIKDGRIVEVGSDVKVPYDAMVIDAKGKVVFPGMINVHTARGLDQGNERLPVTPYLDVYDSIDPANLVFEDALRDGVTALHVIPGNDTVIGGVGRVVHPLGLTVEGMTVKAPSGLKICASGKQGFDSVKQRAELRRVFAELDSYMEDLAERRFEEEEKKAEREVTAPPEEARKKGKELISDRDVDDKHLNLWLLTQGRLDAFFSCPLPRDVGFAVEFAKEHGFLQRTTFVLGAECFKAAAELKASGRPVILPPGLTHRELDPETGKEVETFVVGPLAKAGIPFAFQTFISSSYAERFLWYQAARCLREGVDRKTALASITLVPAQILGLSERLGGITPGRDADLVILSGDPLSSQTQVDTVLIGGNVVYERAKDFRLRRMISGGDTDDGGEAPQGEEEPHEDEPKTETPRDETPPGGDAPAPPQEEKD